MKTSTVFFVIISTFTGGCINPHPQTKYSGEIADVNPTEMVQKDLLLSEVALELSYILLDSKYPFKHINRIGVSDSFYVLAVYPSNILIYDERGSLYNEIGHVGKGPGEYRYAYMFSLDSENHRIYIVEPSMYKIIAYNFDGHLIRELSIKKWGGQFSDIWYQNGLIFLAEGMNLGHGKYDWLVLDTLGNYNSHKPNYIPKFKSSFYHTGHFYGLGQDLYYWNGYNDTIFYIQDSLYHPAFYFGHGKFRWPAEYHKTVSWPFLVPHKFVATRSHLYLHFSWKESEYKYLAYFDYTSPDWFIANKGRYPGPGWFRPGITNDIDGGPDFQIFDTYESDTCEYMLGWRFAYQLKEHVASEAFKNSTPKYPEKKKELEKLANSLSENDNPVLMLIKLKN